MPETKEETSEWAKLIANRVKTPIIKNGEIVAYAYPPPPFDPEEWRRGFEEASARVDEMLKRAGYTGEQLLAEMAEEDKQRKLKRNDS